MEPETINSLMGSIGLVVLAAILVAMPYFRYRQTRRRGGFNPPSPAPTPTQTNAGVNNASTVGTNSIPAPYILMGYVLSGWGLIVGAVLSLAIIGVTYASYGILGLGLLLLLAIAAYGGWVKRTGGGAVIITYLVVIAAVVAVAGWAIFGWEGVTKAHQELQNWANGMVENGFGNADERRNPTIPGVYTDDMQLLLSRPGERRLIKLAGKIKVLSFESRHCIRFTPASAVRWSSNEENTEVLVWPRNAAERLIMVRLRRPGEATCPA